MSVHELNPYESPQAESKFGAESAFEGQVSWKAIAWRWEILRIPYNVVVGLIGVLMLLLQPDPGLQLIEDAIIFALAANVLYLLGPISEMYLNWFVDAQRFLPRAATAWVRSAWLTYTLFVLGTVFSVCVTGWVGLAGAVLLP